MCVLLPFAFNFEPWQCRVCSRFKRTVSLTNMPGLNHESATFVIKFDNVKSFRSRDCNVFKLSHFHGVKLCRNYKRKCKLTIFCDLRFILENLKLFLLRIRLQFQRI